MSKKLVIGITAPLSVILIKGQVKYFIDKGYEVFLMAPEHPETRQFCQDEGSKLIPINIEREISPIKDLIALFQIIFNLWKVKPDVINVGTPKMGLLGSLAGALLGVERRIYTCRGFRYEHENGLKKKILITLDRYACSKVHTVICISKSVQTKGLEDNIFKEEKSVLIGNGSSNGVDLDLFSKEVISKQNISRIIQDLKIQNKTVIGFVGRIVDRKGINELYDSFCQLRNNRDNLHLIIVGKANMAQVSDKDLVRKMEDDPDVTLTGYVGNVNEYMAVMDIFVLPAWWEGFGNTLIQAAAMELPIISCDVTGCRDAVKNGFNGILIPPKEKDILTSTIEALLDDENDRKRLSVNGREWSKRFNSRLIWEGQHQLYNS